MPSYCGVPGCIRTRSSRFFRFPPNENQRNIWLDILKMKNIKENASKLRVCDKHFNPADIIPAPYPGSSARGLQPNTIPVSPGTQYSALSLTSVQIKEDNMNIRNETLESDTTTKTDCILTKTTNETITRQIELKTPHQGILKKIQLHKTSQLTSREAIQNNGSMINESKLITNKKTIRHIRTRLNNITRRVHGLKRIRDISNLEKNLTIVTTRLSLEQKRKIAAWMEVFQSPTVVRTKYAEYFTSDPPSELTIYSVYKTFVKTGSVADD